MCGTDLIQWGVRGSNGHQILTEFYPIWYLYGRKIESISYSLGSIMCHFVERFDKIMSYDYNMYPL